jgi:1-acyl-sn-glycerol-3-phosphate acyltransferase
MHTVPNRIQPKRSIPLLRRGTDADWARPFRPGGQWIGQVRAVRRSILIVLWSLLAAPVQAFCLLLPGRSRVAFAQIYWSVCCRLLGLRIRTTGIAASSRVGSIAASSRVGSIAASSRAGDNAATSRTSRPVVFVSNHSSWLDVVVLGATLPACFVSKRDVADWPAVNLVARLGRTVFVSRLRTTTIRETIDMRRRLAEGDNLILFPEGTTSDGSRVLPFRSSFLAIAAAEPQPLVQPVSIVYDRLAGLPTGRATRPIFAYYGDMSIGPHYWRLAQCHGLGASIVLHQPLDPHDYPDRKALSQAAWRVVAEGAATLRQNRPAKPLAAPAGTTNVA